jgi:hypothetical protein
MSVKKLMAVLVANLLMKQSKLKQDKLQLSKYSFESIQKFWKI